MATEPAPTALALRSGSDAAAAAPANTGQLEVGPSPGEIATFRLRAL